MNLEDYIEYDFIGLSFALLHLRFKRKDSFYTSLPTKDKRKPRTFINLPANKTPQRERFTANVNDASANEVDAHVCLLFYMYLHANLLRLDGHVWN